MVSHKLERRCGWMGSPVETFIRSLPNTTDAGEGKRIIEEKRVCASAWRLWMSKMRLKSARERGEGRDEEAFIKLVWGIFKDWGGKEV